MDGERVDAMARRAGAARSRREALMLMVGLTVGAALPWLVAPEDAAARRHACHIRCGADRQQCKAKCRRTGAYARQCKRECRIWRKQCFGRCEFKPLRRRLAR